LGYFFLLIYLVILVSYDNYIQMQAEEAAHESRKTKQDRYAEMRRKKDEEREAQERLMVGDSIACLHANYKELIS